MAKNSIWDAKMDDSERKSEFPVAQPGEYTFQVEKVVGKEYEPKPGGKIGRCAEIDVRLRVETPEGDVRVFDRLFADPLTIWKMTAFAKSIGVFKTGMNPGQLLRVAEGEIGQAYIKLIPANGQYPEKNEVGRYIEKETEVPQMKSSDNEDLPF